MKDGAWCQEHHPEMVRRFLDKETDRDSNKKTASKWRGVISSTTEFSIGTYFVPDQ